MPYAGLYEAWESERALMIMMHYIIKAVMSAKLRADVRDIQAFRQQIRTV